MSLVAFQNAPGWSYSVLVAGFDSVHKSKLIAFASTISDHRMSASFMILISFCVLCWSDRCELPWWWDCMAGFSIISNSLKIRQLFKHGWQTTGKNIVPCPRSLKQHINSSFSVVASHPLIVLLYSTSLHFTNRSCKLFDVWSDRQSQQVALDQRTRWDNHVHKPSWWSWPEHNKYH